MTHTKASIYLDSNASMPLRVCAKEAVLKALNGVGNPSSQHHFGQKQQGVLEKARAQVAALLHCEKGSVIFTSGGTESNALALCGVAPAMHTLLISQGEHDAVAHNASTAAGMLKTQTPVQKLPLTPNGDLNMDALDDALKTIEAPFLLSVIAANHETGVINDIPLIADKVHQKGGLLHTDAAQFVGKTSNDLSFLAKADLVSLSSHKVGGPQGIGALLVQPHVPLQPLLKGGNQEKGLRSGTQAVALAAGFAAALEESLSCMALTHLACVSTWRDQMEKALLDVAPHMRIWGRHAQRLSQTSSLSMPGVARDTQLMHSDLQGFAVSAGSACRSGLLDPSPVLLAMGASAKNAQESIRVSAGWHTQQNDIEDFTHHWVALYKQIQERTAA
ncbi:MAG: aminotransferase class V-fold PLP-dependent enzyme [Holosporaceae bacterium]